MPEKKIPQVSKQIVLNFHMKSGTKGLVTVDSVQEAMNEIKSKCKDPNFEGNFKISISLSAKMNEQYTLSGSVNVTQQNIHVGKLRGVSEVKAAAQEAETSGNIDEFDRDHYDTLIAGLEKGIGIGIQHPNEAIIDMDLFAQSKVVVIDTDSLEQTNPAVPTQDRAVLAEFFRVFQNTKLEFNRVKKTKIRPTK